MSRLTTPIAIFAALLCAGCMTFQTGVSTPTPQVSRVAVAPFFNLSSEPATNGRQIAETYAGELQKTPGFEVVPVGVVEMALREHKLELSSPADAVKLAEILDVDAVVIGAVTEYEPYQPPRFGLRVSWYSPRSVSLQRVPTTPVYPPPLRERVINRILSLPVPVIPIPLPDYDENFQSPGDSCEPPAARTTMPALPPIIRGQNIVVPKPLMTYTRLFDGRDAVTAAQLRDYVELSADDRAGGWRSYLLSPPDFVRFCCHRMVHEMLTLHGAQDRIRVVYGFRKQK